MRVALTRAISPRIADAELTFIARRPIDVKLAEEQHAQYERRLEQHGCRVVRVAAEREMPDGVFVEDTALVLPECAVITRPGATTRRAEVDSVARALQPYRPLLKMSEPASLDGGDVLRIGKTIYVGRSRRTTDRGISQLRDLVTAFGYSVVPVRFRDCLHLKSAVTAIGEGAIVVNPEWVEADGFAGMKAIEVDPDEPRAANVLAVGGAVLISQAAPRTCRRLERHGFEVDALDLSELEKAEAGVTCCSLIFEA